MALLFRDKTDPAQKLQRDLEAKLRDRRRDRDTIAGQLQASQARADERRDAARALVAAGDASDPKLTSIETEMRNAQDRAKTLTDGLADIDGGIAELEAQVDAVVDQRMRAETVAVVTGMAARMVKAEVAFTAAAQEFEDAARECAPVALDGNPLAAFLMSAKEQVPPANAVVIETLRQYAAAVAAGTARASLPHEAPAAPKVVVPPTMEIVPLQALKYADEGRVVCLGRMQRHGVPLALGELALASGVAVRPTETRARNWIGMFGMGTPSADTCAWLGPPAAPKAMATPRSNVAPIMSSHFEPHPNVPAPYTVKVPVSPVEVPMAAARKLEE